MKHTFKTGYQCLSNAFRYESLRGQNTYSELERQLDIALDCAEKNTEVVQFIDQLFVKDRKQQSLLSSDELIFLMEVLLRLQELEQQLFDLRLNKKRPIPDYLQKSDQQPRRLAIELSRNSSAAMQTLGQLFIEQINSYQDKRRMLLKQDKENIHVLQPQNSFQLECMLVLINNSHDTADPVDSLFRKKPSF